MRTLCGKTGRRKIRVFDATCRAWDKIRVRRERFRMMRVHRKSNLRRVYRLESFTQRKNSQRVAPLITYPDGGGDGLFIPPVRGARGRKNARLYVGSNDRITIRVNVS